MEYGLSSYLFKRICSTLLKCFPFHDEHAIRAKFLDDRINHWRGIIPQANNPNDRVAVYVDFLFRQFNNLNENGLVLFLQVLSENISPKDSCYDELVTLIHQLEQEIQTKQNHDELVTFFSKMDYEYQNVKNAVIRLKKGLVNINEAFGDANKRLEDMKFMLNQYENKQRSNYEDE